MTMKIKIIGIMILIVTTFIGSIYLQDKAAHYSVPAKVIGLGNDGCTLFETPDGNIWGYELPTYIGEGKEVRLNMYDMSPDGKDVTQNIILSVEYNGYDVKSLATETE